MRLRDRILHATASWHTTTDPACREYKPTKEGTAFDARSRGVECHPCLSARLVDASSAADERDELIRQPRATIRCPKCDVPIPIPLMMSLNEDEDGRQYLEAKPDMSDMWAHAWAHDSEGDDA